MSKKECIAMLLAGGEGRRLAPLTSTMAKPAVPFGGQYRIIDFPLSNCVNSNIDTVGVLTQYEANSLHNHIGEGEPWGLHTQSGKGVKLLPSGVEGRDSYTGTADAIYKNIEFIDSHHPEHVLILSADHIYHMNYRKMLDYHLSKNAKATISVMEVPWDEASRFGVMNVNDELKISEFAEKPKVPKSNLASK
ncbi:glucose-1-phosphate adenylyltransferase, partial [Paenibacillus riograndensis]